MKSLPRRAARRTKRPQEPGAPVHIITAPMPRLDRSKPMARKPRTEQEHELALSDEAAAYIADALMQLALEFENNYYSQIRRYYQSIAPEPDNDPPQLELFPEQSS
jgi:hypothetical protein